MKKTFKAKIRKRLKRTIKNFAVLVLVTIQLLTGWPGIHLIQFGINDYGVGNVRADTASAYAGTGANNNDGGNLGWTNPTNFQGNTTTTDATIQLATNGHISQQLRATNFGFSIPSGATINGITADIEASSGNNNRQYYHTVQLLKSSTAVGSNLSPNSAINGKAITTVGGASNLWGTTWSDSDINNSGFGVLVKVNRNSVNTTTTSMFRVQITITYTLLDNTAPTPDPMTFSANPSNTSSTAIGMTASTATDADTPPVTYLFTNDNSSCTASHDGTGGTSSSWQAGTTYSDTGLDPNKCYGYNVKARDSAGTPNETGASSTVTTYTSAAVPGTPTLASPTFTTLTLTNAENGNPATNPTTYFAAQISSTSPTDSTWLNKWVDASGDPSDTAVWLTDAQLDSLVITNLQQSTTYGIKVKARNQDTDKQLCLSRGRGLLQHFYLLQPIHFKEKLGMMVRDIGGRI